MFFALVTAPAFVLSAFSMLYLACTAFLPEIGPVRGQTDDAAADLDAPGRGTAPTDVVADAGAMETTATVGGDDQGVEADHGAATDATTGSDSGGASDAPDAPEASPRTWTVLVGANGALAFSPPALTIGAGETVHWVWQTSGHTVVSGIGHAADGRFCSPMNTQCSSAPTSNAGDTYDHRFATSGQFPYFCMQHDGMTGAIVVQ
jgi:plastocyanin